MNFRGNKKKEFCNRARYQSELCSRTLMREKLFKMLSFELKIIKIKKILLIF